MIEFSHRVAATIVVVLIAALVLQAFRRLRDRRWLVRGTVAAAGLVLGQAALGGLTVEHGLHTALVAAHLGLAMLLLGLLITLRRIAQPAEGAPAIDGSRALRATAAVSAVLLFATIVAGGYVAGTEGEGTPNQPVLGAHLACGEQFPTCLDKFMPFPVRTARRHPAHPPAAHVPDHHRGARDDRGRASAQALNPAARPAPSPFFASRCCWQPDPARGDERLARQAPGADRRPPDAGDGALGDASSTRRPAGGGARRAPGEPRTQPVATDTQAATA